VGRPVTIREVRPDDYASIGELTVDAYRDTAPSEQLPGAFAPDGHFERVYAPMLRDVRERAERVVVYVAEIDHSVVGAVTYVPGPGPYAEFDEPDAAGVRHLAVDPRAQGRGVGAALMDRCLTRARVDGKRRIVLHTQSFMKAARGLYARIGFVRAPERDFSPAPDVDLEGYVLDL
jgi:GNAT superfamily N-acetyltransferase